MLGSPCCHIEDSNDSIADYLISWENKNHAFHALTFMSLCCLIRGNLLQGSNYGVGNDQLSH